MSFVSRRPGSQASREERKTKGRSTTLCGRQSKSRGVSGARVKSETPAFCSPPTAPTVER
jgi:hypothetical protein